MGAHRRGEYRVIFSVQLPLTLMTVIDEIAHSEDVSASAVVVRALRAGLAQERDARQVAAQMREKGPVDGN